MNISKNIFLLIVFTIASGRLFCQDTITIKGSILGDGNKGVADVSVSVQGVLSAPQITDSSGNFTISLTNSYVNLILTPPEQYKSQIFFLSGKTNPVIKLTETDMPGNMDEANNGIEFIPLRDFVSSVSILETNTIHKSPYQTIDEYFIGNVSGIWGNGSSGMPGNGSVNFIRGIHSMNSNSQPLYIIDGLPIEVHGIMGSNIDGFAYDPLSAINPADITNITIVKDNTKASLFGVRGSNGIVLIETLKPTEIQTSIDVSYRTGISQAPKLLPQLESDQYRTFAKEVLMSSDIPEENFPLLYPGLYVTAKDPIFYKYNNNTNWQNVIFRNAVMQDFYLKIHGGDEIAKYGLSVGYQKNQGLIKDTNFDRFSVRFVGNFNMFRWLKFNVSSNLTSNTSNLKESARISQTSPILSALFKNPLMIPYQFDSNGHQLIVREDLDKLGVSNPLSVIEGFSAYNRNYKFLTSLRIEGEISDHLKVNSLIGINFNSLNEKVFMPDLGMELYYNDEAYNASKSLSNYFLSFANDNYISYDRKFGDEHTFLANAGMRVNTNKLQYDYGIAKNSNQNDQYTTLQSGTSNLRELGGDNGKWNRLSFYSNFNYTLKQKYGIDLNTSVENSTRIGPNAQNVFFISDIPFGFFYGAGIFWRISNEPIFKNLQWIDDLKLRLSYGKSGNDDIGNFDAYNYLYIVHYRNTTGMVPGPLTDESLSFEEFYQLNTGLDFTTWGNRFSLSADIYKNRTDNLLINKVQHFYLGNETVPVNQGEIENRGWEFEMFSRIIQKNKFSFDINANISHFSNKVLSIANDFLITPFQGGEYISRTGENMLSFYGYEYNGVFKSTDDAKLANLVNEDGLPFGAGDAIFSDLSGPEGKPDGVINKFDKTIIGSPVPDFTGSLNSRISYGKLSLEIMLEGIYGNELFNYVRSVNEKMDGVNNQSLAVLNRWQYEGQETDVPRALWADPMKNSAFSSRWIEDGSFIRLKNVTLEYNIPEKFLLFRNARFYISATNLLTFTRYLGYDPEFAISFQTMEQGIDYGLTPYSRTFLIGVKFGL